MRRSLHLCVLIGLALAALCLPSARPALGNTLAATVPSGFFEIPVASGMPSPTAMAFAPDGRLFVAQQGGQLRVIKNDLLLSTPFLSVPVDSDGERGLLGVAFDPDFTTNKYVYIYYTTNTAPIHNRLSRFTANGDVALAGSELPLLELNNLSGATNHNGGALHFGPDGKLYVAVGENATSSNAQALGNLLGKMLRLNKDGSIPTDNPFYNSATGQNRAIWALGLRNPFTFAFQPGSGRMFINDVGQGSWEEINDGLAGANYGWPTSEGDTSNPDFEGPLYTYSSGTQGQPECAITGGTFYNPPTAQFPNAYVGHYFFADFCAGWIKQLDPQNPRTPPEAPDFATGIGSPVDLAVSADGSLYYLARGSGGIVRKIRFGAAAAPQITQQPTNQRVAVGQPASFSVAATGDTPLTYQWQRNGTNIPNANTATYTLAATQLSDSGATFRCVVSNSTGSATSNAGTLTVVDGNAPTGSISAPAEGARYTAGDTISYAGSGSDTEDGTLPAAAFTWQVDFHHDEHVHPFVPATSGAIGGTFTIPTEGETAANVFYRITLTLSDSTGLEFQTYRDLLPLTATLTLQTSPPGLQLRLDGQPQATPLEVVGVAGITRTLVAISPQTADGTAYEFVEWSNGGPASQSISFPAENGTLTAVYRALGPAEGRYRAWLPVVNK